jgi:transmembrane sensor
LNSFDQKFIENPLFVRWIFNSDPAIESHWEKYLLEHPEEKEQLFELKALLSELKPVDDTLPVAEKEELRKSVMGKIEQGVKPVKTRNLVPRLMKYAAAVLVISTISGLLFYLKSGKESAYKEFAGQTIVVPNNAEGPMLITSNGNNVNLKKANSTVDYSRKGSVVLNNDSVLQTPEEDLNTMNQLVIPYGNQSRVVLSDHTVVWLNAGSRLVYPTRFAGKTREVLLIGEAFFEVAKNPDQPFVVKVSGIDIRVLGTKFNVSAYEEDNLVNTVLSEGSVAIRRTGAKFFEKDLVISPNQMASYDKTSNDTRVSEVSAEAYSLWTRGLISFDEVDFSRAIKQVERFYNISVVFADHRKEVIRISGKLDLKRSKSEVMEYLEKVSLSSFEQLNEHQYVIK